MRFFALPRLWRLNLCYNKIKYRTCRRNAGQAQYGIGNICGDYPLHKEEEYK